MKRTQQIVLGPPGTGKTTFLLNEVATRLAGGIPARRIAYVSFTRKAAHEAVERALLRFGGSKAEFPYFSTLHSLAFRELGLSKERVMGAQHYKRIGEALGLQFSDYMDFEEGVPVGQKDGDRVLYCASIARARLVSLREQWHTNNDGTNWFQLEQFAATLKRYKEDTGMMDFTDMLDDYLECDPLPIDVAFIDEAQDLSRQQWRMVRHAVSKAKEVFIAGDDDQAIYRWSGADVESFLQLQGERRVLDRSYRLPRSVFALCNRISSRIGRRFPKQWQPREEDGRVTTINGIHNLEFGSGSYLILARNKYLLKDLEDHVRRAGVPYTTGRSSSVKKDSIQAILDWEQLRRGEPLLGSRIKAVYQFLNVGTGVQRGFKSLSMLHDEDTVTMAVLVEAYGLLRTDIWHEALEKMPVLEREFYVAAKRRNEKLTVAPRVHISTIHGVKGGEADHVVLLPDLAWRTYNEYVDAPDDEHRVFYVAASRARHNLMLLSPTGNKFYPV